MSVSLLPPVPTPPHPQCPITNPQQRKLESEQWLRRVEAAKTQAHPDNVAHITGELETLVKEVDTLMEAANMLPIQTTQQLLQLKDVKISLGIQLVLVQRSHSRQEPAPSHLCVMFL
jgi:hypothetical protein